MPPRRAALVALLRTADAVKRSMSGRLAPHGITVQQYNVLRILRGAQDEHVPTLAIADRMMEKTPGITRLIDRLETKRWVERYPCPEDRRRIYCRITPPGLALLADLDPVVDEADDATMRGLPVAKARELVRLLEGIQEPLR